MAETNGISNHEDTVSVSHLGKRKRAATPEIENSRDPTVQPVLQDVLHILRKHDPSPSLLKYPLPTPRTDGPDIKRARIVKSESVSDTIEDRILNGTYSSLHALKDDVKNVHDAILINASAGTKEESIGTDVQKQLAKVLDVLEEYVPESPDTTHTNGEVLVKTDSIKQKAKQFLSLRSTVNGGGHALFSGLRGQEQVGRIEPDTLPRDVSSGLPNGFELGDFSALGGKEADTKKEKRTFEKVFTTFRRLKPLDLPHPAKDVVRANSLNFIPNPSRTENLPLNKHDYKYAKLPTGSWLSYRRSQQDRKNDRRSSSGTDFKAALAANNVRQGKDMSEEELFSSVYSSFAPSSDNTYSLISDEDLGRQWWSQHGEQKLSRLFRSTDQVSRQDEETAFSDEFADMVASFEPQKAEEDAKPSGTLDEVDALLQEVSEMIETLGSYQRNRSLDIIASGKVQKPDKPEFDAFEMLRNQLTIVIASLPPFAVAKLDGDQLEALNISTRIVVEAPDFSGTGQPDDYLLRRQKMAQQTAQAVARPAATPQPVRPNYSSVQANTMSYNSQLRNYTASVPATAAFGMRTAPNYNTPTATRTTYSQTPTFQASTSNSHSYSGNRPTIQQFQRPALQNGYSSHGSNNTPLQPSQQQSQSQTPGTFPQRATQPGYQQRAQDNAAALARSGSPQKPSGLVNGAGSQTPRPYPLQQSQSQAAAQQSPYTRANSGTPIAPATATAPGSTPQTQQRTSQTVEVSR